MTIYKLFEHPVNYSLYLEHLMYVIIMHNMYHVVAESPQFW